MNFSWKTLFFSLIEKMATNPEKSFFSLIEKMAAASQKLCKVCGKIYDPRCFMCQLALETNNEEDLFPEVLPSLVPDLSDSDCDETPPKTETIQECKDTDFVSNNFCEYPKTTEPDPPKLDDVQNSPRFRVGNNFVTINTDYPYTNKNKNVLPPVSFSESFRTKTLSSPPIRKRVQNSLPPKKTDFSSVIQKPPAEEKLPIIYTKIQKVEPLPFCIGEWPEFLWYNAKTLKPRETSKEKIPSLRILCVNKLIFMLKWEFTGLSDLDNIDLCLQVISAIANHVFYVNYEWIIPIAINRLVNEIHPLFFIRIAFKTDFVPNKIKEEILFIYIRNHRDVITVRHLVVILQSCIQNGYSKLEGLIVNNFKQLFWLGNWMDYWFESLPFFDAHRKIVEIMCNTDLVVLIRDIKYSTRSTLVKEMMFMEGNRFFGKFL